MKYASLALLSLGLLAACQSRQEKQHALATDTVPASEVAPADTMLKGTVVADDLNAYGSSVPYKLQRYIEQELPGYRIPAWKRMSQGPEREVPPPGGEGAVVHGDWNCDSTKDYAMVLESPAHEVRTWVFVADKGSFTRDTISFRLNLPDSTAPIGYYLIGRERRNNPLIDWLRNTEVTAENAPSICDYILISIPEKSARAWYWHDKIRKWSYFQRED